jgi:hypothetical protein
VQTLDRPSFNVNRLSLRDLLLIEQAQERMGKHDGGINPYFARMMASAGPGPGGAQPTGSGTKQPQLYPFAAGTREIRLPVGQLAFSAGATVQMPSGGPIPKSGFFAAYYLTYIGSVTVSVAGTAGTPNIWNVLQNVNITANYGYQYRNLDGDSLRFMANINLPFGGYNVPNGTATYQNYNPASATAQAIEFSLTDNIALNEGINYQDFLISTQTLDSDLIFQVTWSAINGAINANTETINALTGTLYCDGLWFSVPDRTKFSVPKISFVQQISSGDSGLGTTVAAGVANTINLTPVQGPRYLQLALKVTENGSPDPATYGTYMQQFELKANNAESLFIQTAQRAIARQTEFFNRVLPAGWFVFDFLHDTTFINAKGMYGRNIISTQLYSTLWMIVTTLSTMPTPTSIKVVKRIAAPIQS